ncbi:hypothetical protein DRO59_00150 [Candidatus Bathyarchaeota archaeon]|nr:MAG: hypothetical protein DRO59_00150 [Candidatus Bathyarchaeota archaeon]
MWLLILLMAVLFGAWLSRGGAELSKWVLAAIIALILGWIIGMITVAVVPSLTAYMLPAEVQLQAYIALDIIGLVAGFLTGKAYETITK